MHRKPRINLRNLKENAPDRNLSLSVRIMDFIDLGQKLSVNRLSGFFQGQKAAPTGSTSSFQAAVDGS